MPDVLLERDAELRSLRSKLSAARRCEGGVIVVEGPAGAGKSALLRQLREDATTTDVQVRTAAGGELEREFPFGIVRQLLEPVVRAAPLAERTRLLEGAAALAAPVLGLGESDAATAADPTFATLHGLYWLVAAMTETRPLLLVIDDAHWADEPSLRFCDFLARRAGELPLLMTLGLRPREAGAAHDLLASIADAPEAEAIRPGALSGAAVRRLVTDALGEEIPDDVVASAHGATGGNPLLLRELVRTLATWDGVPTVGVVEAAVPSSVTRSVQRRLRRLPRASQRTARALAVLGERVTGDVLVLAAEVEMETLAESLAPLHAADLVEGDPPRFVHPLVRQAVADGVSPAERTQLHRTAAEAFHARPDGGEQAVVHLLAIPPGGFGWAAPLLREAARRAAADGAADVAVRRLERARAELGGDAGADVLLELGLAQMAAGDPSAIEHLAVAAAADDPIVAAKALSAQLSIGAIDTARQAVAAIRRSETLLAALPGEPHRSVREELESGLLDLLTLDPRLADERRTLIAKARERPGPATLPILCCEAAGGNGTRDEGLALIRRCVEPGVLAGMSATQGGAWVSTAALAFDAPDEVENLLAVVDDFSRRSSSRMVSAFGDYERALHANLYGQLALAEALLQTAIDHFREFENIVLERSARAELAFTLIAVGRPEEAEAQFAGIEDEAFDELRLVGCTWRTRRAEVRAWQGRWSEVLVDLRRVEETLPLWGWQQFVLGFNDTLMARALVATGERDEGLARAQAAVADADRRGVPHAAAHAYLALGLALTGDEAVEALATAAEIAERTTSHRVRATVLAEQGGALRRAGRRTDARASLAAARVAAHRVGASGIFARATEELALAGGRPRRIALSGAASLTPAERRVAEHAASGLSNREIAEVLFVTRKTVEFTLGRVFTKLEIKSRTQLPEVLGNEP